MSGEVSGFVSEIVARRYADWLREHMAARGWSQAETSRQTGLAVQTLITILAGRAFRPTALQISALATALDVSPSEIFSAIGLWRDPGGGRPRIDPELAYRFGLLKSHERAAVIDMLRGMTTPQDDDPDSEPPAPLPIPRVS